MKANKYVVKFKDDLTGKRRQFVIRGRNIAEARKAAPGFLYHYESLVSGVRRVGTNA